MTDRFDARAVYLACCLAGGVAALAFAFLAEGLWTAMLFRAIGGVSLAGTPMVGLQRLSDRLDEAPRSRAVAASTASFRLGASLWGLVGGEHRESAAEGQNG